MKDVFDRHQKIVFQFSGGKDSLACLHLLRPYWNRLTVVWINTGAAFRETLVQMAAVKVMVPNFLEVSSDQPKQIEENGPPSDLLPWWDTTLGRLIYSSRTKRAQSPYQCCGSNLWAPMSEAVARLGATLVIRGQRNQEGRKSAIRSGHIENGIEYLFPIEDWSGERVREFLTEQGVELPAHYAYVDSSLDCWSCTAYLDENAGKFKYMKRFYPNEHAKVVVMLREMKASAVAELAHIERALE